MIYMCGSDLHSWSSDFTLNLEDYLMDKCHLWDIGSVRDKHKKIMIAVV